MDGGLAQLKLRQLRLAIHRNTVTFPSAAYEDSAEWRMAHLFFVSGWSVLALAQRYKIPPGRAGALIREWIERAIAAGFVQEIPPEPEPLAGHVVVEFRKHRSTAPSAVKDRDKPRGSRRRKYYTDPEIAAILGEVESGGSIQEICRNRGISPRTLQAWQLQSLRDENRELRLKLSANRTILPT